MSRRRRFAVALLAGAAFLATVAAPPASADSTGTLSVQVSGLQSTTGKLRFVLFDDKKTFLKQPLRAVVLVPEDIQVTWTVEDLAFGRYAVLVHHDLDGNGKMERHWYGKPKEPTGTSNNPPPRMGPPKWKQASFDFAAETQTITISLSR